MLAVVSLWLCLFVVSIPSQPVLGEQSDSLWLFRESGDIVLHGLYPIRRHINSEEGFGLNYEGLVWTGAMIHRIQQINQEKLLPGNLTLGYAIRDTGREVKTGLRQTLSALNEILNKQGGRENLHKHIPAVLGPATDELEDTSKKLYKLFDVPRIAYTTTSGRFGYNEKIIRTVPSDIIHIEALLRLLNDMKTLEFSAIVAKSKLWEERMNVFRAALEQTKSRIKLKEIIYVNAVNVSVMHQRLTSKVVIIFAGSNISRSLIPRKAEKSRDRIWIQVCQFDDPLLRIFDTFGKFTKKVIVRNSRTDDVDEYRSKIAKSLLFNDAGDLVGAPNWLKTLFENHCKHSSGHNESGFNKECIGFRKRINLAIGIGHHDEFRSSLTLQGIIDGVNLIIASLRDALEQCGSTTPRQCLKFSGSTLFKKLKPGTLTNEALYSIQVLRQVKDTEVSGRRTKTKRGWTFRKIREWRISKSEIQDKLRKYWPNSTLPNNVINAIRPSLSNINLIVNSSNNASDNCMHCREATNQSNCIPDNIVIDWVDSWAIALYFLEGLCLLAVVSTFVYFSQHKNSPIMILCYSWPDNIILAVLCIFSVLPMVHIGEMTSYKCTILWPIVNIVFAFYIGLLLTKTLFVQNLLKCEVATERPGRRLIFATIITLIQILIHASLCIFDYPKTTHLACSSHGIVMLCNIEGNIGILVAMTFNWLLMCVLFALSVTETLRQRQNFCRTENLVAVATVTWISYTCMAALGYYNIRVKHYLAVALIQSVIYLVNSAVCLGLIYAPTLRLVSTWLRQHTRQKKNLTSIKRAQVMSSKRQTSGPMRDSIFGANFSNEHLASPSGRHSGYYFDLRPSSAVTDFSYPTSLVRSVHEHTHVVFGYGRRGVGTMSLNGATSVESVPSIDWLAAPSEAHSASSSYDNLSRAGEETEDELSPQELLHEISTYWERHRSSDVIANGQHEDNIETNKWPSLEKLRTSDL